MTLKVYITSCLTGLLLTSACTAPAPLQSEAVHTETAKPPLPEIEVKAPTTLSPTIQSSLEKYPDRYKTNFMKSFDDLRNGDEVRSAQIEALMQQRLAQQRGQLIGAILGGDANSDGDLDTNEILSLVMNGRTQSLYNRGKPLPLTQGDRNGDGIFSADEIRNFSNLFVDIEKITGYEPVFSLMAFDTNEDSILTRAEIEQELSVFESETAKSAPAIAKSLPRPNSSVPQYLDRQEAQQNLRDEVCKSKLKLPKDAKFVLLSGYEGNSLSTVMVAGKHRDTEVAQVIIEEGDTPLYIIAGAYTPMIWSIEGDISRVSGFIAAKASGAANAGGAGIMGLPADKVDFIDPSCMGYFTDERDKNGILAKTLFGRIYERPIDYTVTKYSIDSVKLPSGESMGEARRRDRIETEKKTGAKRTKVAKGLAYSARENYAPARQTMLHRFFPDGIAYVDPEHVLAPEPLSTYEVYPDHAGIAQLLESGHLERIENGTYYIKKTFPYYPAGLGGAHSVEFILGKGVQRPGGSPGHSALIDEATGRCVGARCPRR